MSLSQWVTLKEDYEVRTSTGELYCTIPAGTLGRLHDVDETGALYVCFPHAHITPKLTDLAPFPMPSVEDAVDLIKEFSGHHCNSSQYQFNIKFHHFPPQHVFNKCGDEPTWDEYNERLRDELRYFMDEDYGIKRIIPWVASWHQAGRSGGWLVIDDIIDRDIDDLYARYKENLISIQADPNGEEGRIAAADNQDLYEQIMDIALGIRYIGEAIRIAKTSLGKWIESDEPWQELIEIYGSEEGEDPDYDEQ